MNSSLMPLADADHGLEAVPELPWPPVAAIENAAIELAAHHRLALPHEADHALGHMQSLAVQLACIQANEAPLRVQLDRPQLVVFAADHGLADEGVSLFAQDATRQRVLQLVAGTSPVNGLAALHGFDMTVVDAGVASHIVMPSDESPRVPLLLRKIGYGTRNMVLAQAMSQTQARSAIQAGMDVVRHLPGNVLALSNNGVAGNACAALILSRLCGVPLADACGKDAAQDPAWAQRRLQRLFAAASRHRKATAPLDVLAAMGGFEIAMMCGAMVQAASERRVVLVDGFVAGAAALLARAMVPTVADYLVFAHRSAEPGHRLLLIHLQARPLVDMELRSGQGLGALLAWPLLMAAQRLLEHPPPDATPG
jgi:nicotinate-nucleotide--dimethylbenzimidazole phosphoribosyltransferase